MPPDGNYTIYPHKDGVRAGLPWIIEDYEERGAFNSEQLDELMARFTFSEGEAMNLSICLGNSLDIGSAVCMIPVSRDKAVGNAGKLLRRTLRHMRQTEPKRSAVIEALEKVDNLFASDEERGLLDAARTLAQDPSVSCEELDQAVKALISTNGAALIAPDNARKTPDQRTRTALDQCFYTWRDAGRELTYTTHSDKPNDPRGGPLIEFIQWVAAELTSPSSTLSGHTILEHIKRFKAKEAREARRRAERQALGPIQRPDGTMQERTELDMPPIFGEPDTNEP